MLPSSARSRYALGLAVHRLAVGTFGAFERHPTRSGRPFAANDDSVVVNAPHQGRVEQETVGRVLELGPGDAGNRLLRSGRFVANDDRHRTRPFGPSDDNHVGIVCGLVRNCPRSQLSDTRDGAQLGGPLGQTVTVLAFDACTIARAT
jgi:hypothetical protein